MICDKQVCGVPDIRNIFTWSGVNEGKYFQRINILSVSLRTQLLHHLAPH